MTATRKVRKEKHDFRHSRSVDCKAECVSLHVLSCYGLGYDSAVSNGVVVSIRPWKRCGKTQRVHNSWRPADTMYGIANKAITHAAVKAVDLAGKKVVVVGGTAGLGQAIANAAAAKGAATTVVGRSFKDAGVSGVSFEKADLSRMSEAVRIGRELRPAHGSCPHHPTSVESMNAFWIPATLRCPPLQARCRRMWTSSS